MIQLAIGIHIAGLLLAASLAGAVAESGASGIRWQPPIEVAAGPAHKGPWRQNDSDYRYLDDPAVAIDRAGRIAVAYVDQARQNVYFQRYDAAGRAILGAPVDVSRSPGIFSWLPRVRIDPKDPERIFILWQEIVFSGGSHGGEIFFAASRDGGRSFSKPLNLTNSIAGEGKGRLTAKNWHNGSLDLAIGADGALHAAWTEYRGRLWVVHSTDQGASFSRPVHVSGSRAAPARGPSLAVGPSGAVHIAWTVGEDRAANIQIATSRDGGRSFSKPRPVARTSGHGDAPKLALDTRGVLHLVYGESPDGPFRRYHIRYTRSRDDGRSFDAPRRISGPDTSAFKSANFPHIAIVGRRIYIIWELFPRAGGYWRGLGLTMSWDDGRSFAPASMVPGSADPADGFTGGRQGFLMQKLAVNAAGKIAITHSTFDRGRASRVWLFRGQRRAPRP